MSTIAERIRELREKKGLSQSEVAKLLGMNRTTYVHYETGYSKPTKKLKDLCALFNVSADYILGNDTNTSNTQTENKPKDLIKLLEKEEYTLNGVLVNQEDKEKLKRIIEAAFWDAKEKNKRKK